MRLLAQWVEVVVGVEDDHGSSARPDLDGLHFLVVTDVDSTCCTSRKTPNEFYCSKMLSRIKCTKS